jgi:hypothetical protein
LPCLAGMPEIEEGVGTETSVTVHVQFANLHRESHCVIKAVHDLLGPEATAGLGSKQRLFGR